MAMKNRTSSRESSRAAQLLKTLFKQAVMLLYNHQLITGTTVLRLFDQFELWNA